MKNRPADETSPNQSPERSLIELTLASDALIEGFVRAMDVREKEVSGHTQRVAELTTQLARSCGVAEADLPDIRRGALLHDIGKMGIPELILLRAGPLDDAEWALVRRHPQYAYDLLYPVVFLHKALDIPYYHHEKWDGSGYPHGVKGKDIPRAARIFAVVDVWDALTSDRPFRKAWAPDKAREHIRSLAGTHFDPEIVDIFLQTIGAAGETAAHDSP